MTGRVLILGGTGYLGSRLAAALVTEGLAVAVLKRRSSSLERLSGPGAVTLLDLESGGLEAALRWQGGVDVVVNTAGAYGRRGETAAEVLEANVMLPLRLLAAGVTAGLPLFINAGTALSPSLNGYALSKRQFSEWGRLLSHESRLCFVDVRIEHFYGPGDDDVKFATHAAQAFVAGVPEYRLTPGDQERDFIYIDDVVRGFATIVRRRTVFASGYESLGLGSGVPVSVRRFVELMHAASQSATRLEFGALAYRPNEVMRSCADTSHLRALGWVPAVALEDGVERLVAAEQARMREG